MTETEGLAALPPNPEGPQSIIFKMPEPPTFTELCWSIANGFALTLILLSVAALIVMLAYNGITNLTHLPEIGWREAFAGLVLLRLFALTARL